MRLETKFFLALGVITLAVLVVGTGSLTLQEAKVKADKQLATLSSDQLERLTKAQRKFSKVAFPLCTENTGRSPGEFIIVIETNSKGSVGRLWRQGDSEFVLCLQKLVQDNFIFRSRSQSLFIAFANTNAS